MPATAAIEELTRKYPKSRWRLQAIVAQANSHLVKNEANLYEPLYRTCYRDFPDDTEAAFCHWKVAWASHMRREGPAMLEEHIRLYPQSEKVSAALYFLGRYSELVSRYPLSYYSTLARDKSVAARAKRTQLPDFQPSPAMQVRLDRAQSLESLGYRSGPSSS